MMDVSLIPEAARQVNATRWKAFCAYMADKRYGRWETKDAWDHFAAGWEARDEEITG